MTRTRVLLLACLLVAGCALPKVAPPLSISPDAKSIKLVVMAPDKIQMGVSGATVFENQLNQVDASGWQFRETLEDAAKAVLSSRYKVKMTDWRPPQAPVFLSDAKKLQQQIADQAQTVGDADLVLAIWPTNENQLVYTGRVVTGFIGFGVSKQNNIFFDQPPLVHSFGAVALYDGKTHQLLGARPIQLSPEDADKLGFANNKDAGRELVGIGYDGLSPLAPVSYGTLPDHWNDLPVARQNEIKDKLKSLLSVSISYTLSHMFFGDVAGSEK